jgi:hypothetical protein
LTGLVHVVAVPLSSEHLNVEPVFVELKLNVALVWLVGFAGPELIVTTGAVVSIVHVLVALPVLPAASVPVTVKVCEPARRLLYVTGDEQADAVPLSSLQLKVVPVLFELKVNVAPVAFVGFAGPEPIVTTGGVVSIVHVLLALPVLPAASVPVTVNVCEPAARPV